MHGSQINLPAGYSGLVLTINEENTNTKESGQVGAKRKRDGNDEGTLAKTAKKVKQVAQSAVRATRASVAKEAAETEPEEEGDASIEVESDRDLQLPKDGAKSTSGRWTLLELAEPHCDGSECASPSNPSSSASLNASTLPLLG